MSESENAAIAVIKDKAKHLHSMLKPRVPDIKLGECYNYIARLHGAKDWNTLCTKLQAMGNESEVK